MQDFLVDRIKPLTAALLSQAMGDDSLAKLLRTSIKNWLTTAHERPVSGISAARLRKR